MNFAETSSAFLAEVSATGAQFGYFADNFLTADEFQYQRMVEIVGFVNATAYAFQKTEKDRLNAVIAGVNDGKGMKL